jgi:hypothetical protein
MLINVDPKLYYHFFSNEPHSFISKGFTELNNKKVEKVLYITEESNKPRLGLVTGLRDNWLLSPFSAPFGGFHFRKEVMYVSEIEIFLKSLQEYIVSNRLSGIRITLPPDVYHQTINAKTVKALYQKGFKNSTLDITNWVDLKVFQGIFTQKNSKEYYKQALRNELKFRKTDETHDHEEIYDLIRSNRERSERSIYMSLDDITDTGALWPVDYFKVTNNQGIIIAAAIFYRNHPEIVYALFWGDSLEGRKLRAMDFLAFQLWTFYKEQKFSFVDLGISTENGKPNEGLLRFKESHEAISSLKYTFTWSPE